MDWHIAYYKSPVNFQLFVSNLGQIIMSRLDVIKSRSRRNERFVYMYIGIAYARSWCLLEQVHESKGMPAVVTKFQPESSPVSYPVSWCIQGHDKCCFKSLGVDINGGCNLRDQLHKLFP